MTSEEFVAYIIKKTLKAGISLKLINEESVPYDNDEKNTCSGYFDEHEIVVATKKKESDWVGVLAHEYCHLTQKLNNVFQEKIDYEASNNLEKGITGKRVSSKKFKESVDRVQAMELDNERRTIRLLKRLKVELDYDNYIRKANSYIYLYTLIKKYRKWIMPNCPPYKFKEITNLMPTKFLKDYSDVPEEVEKHICKLSLGFEYKK